MGKKKSENQNKKKKWRKILLQNLLIFVVVVLLFNIFSYVVYHRSGAATIAAIGIRLFNTGELSSPEKAEEAMVKRSEEEDQPFVFHKEKYRSQADIYELGRNQVITFGEKEGAADTILYLHGGAYINEITSFHLQFLDKLSGETNAYIVVPLYPLAPNHTYPETYEMLDLMYPKLRREAKRLTIMGDSAGGGLAFAYCEYLLEKKESQPDRIIVFSPWVDVSMSAVDHSDYEPLDPMLEVPGTIKVGQEWTGSSDTKNYMVSPLFGKMEGLPRTLMFVGTREILFPDCQEMYRRLEQAKVDVELVIGQGMTHIYPIYPLIPESIAAMERVKREFQRQ